MVYMVGWVELYGRNTTNPNQPNWRFKVK